MSDPRASLPSVPSAEERTTLPGRSADGLPPIVMEAPHPASPTAALRIGAAMASARILRRELSLAVLLGAALVVLSAVLERRVTVAGAVDRTLAATFNLVVPLASFTIAAMATGRQSLGDAVWSAARYGVARRDVALGVIGAAAITSAALSAALSALAVVAAGGGGGDAITSAWIAALTATAYVSWFSLGATFGKRGGGRLAVLLVDFAIGGSAGIAGAILPRGNAASLLGGPGPLHLPQASSSALLLVSALSLAGLAAVRCRE